MNKKSRRNNLTRLKEVKETTEWEAQRLKKKETGRTAGIQETQGDIYIQYNEMWVEW